MRKLQLYLPVLLFALLSSSIPVLGSATRSFRPQADTSGVVSSSPAPGWRGAALRANLFYAGTATPNLGLDIALGQHVSLGVTRRLPDSVGGPIYWLPCNIHNI